MADTLIRVLFSNWKMSPLVWIALHGLDLDKVSQTQTAAVKRNHERRDWKSPDSPLWDTCKQKTNEQTRGQLTDRKRGESKLKNKNLNGKIEILSSVTCT